MVVAAGEARHWNLLEPKALGPSDKIISHSLLRKEGCPGPGISNFHLRFVRHERWSLVRLGPYTVRLRQKGLVRPEP